MADIDAKKIEELRDTWWLVERRGCYLWTTGRGSFHGLTSDATRATRFATEHEASEEIRRSEDCFRDELFASEHKFVEMPDLASQTIASLPLAGEDVEGLLSQLDGHVKASTDTHLYAVRHTDMVRAAAALIRSLSLRVEAEKRERERLKDRIDLRMNDYLVEMREGYDDSITGFNEAWDIVRSVFADMESNNAGK